MGNPALMRAILDARQVLSEPLSRDLAHDLRQVFNALLEAGAEPDWVDPRFGVVLGESGCRNSARRVDSLALCWATGRTPRADELALIGMSEHFGVASGMPVV